MMRAEEERTPLLGRKRERRRPGGGFPSPSMDRDDSADADKDYAARHIPFSPSEDDILVEPTGEVTTTPTRPPYPQSRRRFIKRSATPRQEQDRQAYSGGVGSFDDLAPDNVGTPPRQRHNYQQKEDRRNLLQRARQFIRQTFVFPTWGYQNIEGDPQSLYQARCTLGTREMDGTWLNYTDQAGTAMALLVWVLIGYCAGTMIVLARHGHMPPHVCAAQVTLSVLIWACHAKTMLTDPGTIPSTAVPLVTKGVKFHTMCSVCQSYKPSYTHHCRICNRCISRMDHHCPWMNNCVGAANLKHFTLFLVYSWLGSFSALAIFAWNYFFCGDQNCEFHGLEIQLVRAMSLICFGTLLFTSSMLMNVVYGIMTGTGTIDRLKQKADATWHLSDEQPTPAEHIWGTGSKVGWCLPVDPVWEDFGKIHGYTTAEDLTETDNML